MFRDKYSTIYPLSHKTNHLINLNDLKFIQTNDNEVYRQILVGNILNYEAQDVSSQFPFINTLSKHIKNTIIIPIEDLSGVIGFMFICVNHYNDLQEESELLEILGHNVGIVNSHINNTIKNNICFQKNLDGLARYLDYNIKGKILFTLGVIEISNFDEIINSYNLDFYEAFKNEASKMISKALSHNDYILCFDKDDIYIVFNLLDYKNAINKLKDLSSLIESFSLRGVTFSVKTNYVACEYPVEGINSDEIISKVYRKLHKEKNA
jgi:hypothetical protein